MRGIGSLIAFTLDSPQARDEMLKSLMDKRMLALASGERAVRFRTPLNVSSEEIRIALECVADCLPSRVQA